MARHWVAARDDVKVGGLRRVEAEGVQICLARAQDGSFYAISDLCTHEQASLSDGDLWDTSVECPMHSSRFDIRTGAVTGMPAELPTETYPVTVEGDQVFVDV